MAKSQEKIKARVLRKNGESIKDIARLLGVSKSSASIWCQDIELTIQQIENLNRKMLAGNYIGSIKGARIQRERKEMRINEQKNIGIKKIGVIKNRNLLFAGLGLYLGEGNKAWNKFQFSNSNPQILKLFILWLEKCFEFPKIDLVFTVFINEIHILREETVKKYWIKTLDIKTDQFRKTTFIKSKNKKVYENFTNHFGTLSIRAKKSSSLQHKILGLCYGLLVNSGINEPV